MEWKDFEPLVRRISNSIKIPSYEREDVKQELLLKLTEIMPKLEALTQQDAFRLCHRCLSNHAYGLYRHQVRCQMKNKNLTSVTSFDEEVFHSVIGVAIDAINHAENKMMCDSLEGDIIEWAKKQCPANVANAFCDWVIQVKNGESTRIVNGLVEKWGISSYNWQYYRNKLRKYLSERDYSGHITLAKDPTLGTT